MIGRRDRRSLAPARYRDTFKSEKDQLAFEMKNCKFSQIIEI